VLAGTSGSSSSCPCMSPILELQPTKNSYDACGMRLHLQGRPCQDDVWHSRQATSLSVNGDSPLGEHCQWEREQEWRLHYNQKGVLVLSRRYC
jgi:hypothetical protein